MVDSETSWGQDFAGGVLIALLGIGAIAIGQTYGIGTLQKMEPGFFPVAVGVILGCIGVALGISALRRRPAVASGGWSILSGGPDWRGWGFIIAGMVAFLALGNRAGLAPAAFACVFLSAMGDRTTTVRRAVILAACVTVFGSILFSLILKVQMPLLAWWRP